MEKESTGEWRFGNGSDVPASFSYDWFESGLSDQVFPQFSRKGRNFMALWCERGVEGPLWNFYKTEELPFICQDQTLKKTKSLLGTN